MQPRGRAGEPPGEPPPLEGDDSTPTRLTTDDGRRTTDRMILILVGLLCAGPPSVSEKVVEFARSKLGQTVGGGDCTALAIEALRHAGAEPIAIGTGCLGR